MTIITGLNARAIATAAVIGFVFGLAHGRQYVSNGGGKKELERYVPFRYITKRTVSIGEAYDYSRLDNCTRPSGAP